jgi:hypothetical protein
MKRNVLMIIGLSLLMLAATGCRAGGPARQPLFSGGYQQPNPYQTQQTMGQFGRNFGNRLVNGVMNRGVNYLINGAISAF